MKRNKMEQNENSDRSLKRDRYQANRQKIHGHKFEGNTNEKQILIILRTHNSTLIRYQSEN